MKTIFQLLFFLLFLSVVSCEKPKLADKKPESPAPTEKTQAAAPKKEAVKQPAPVESKTAKSEPVEEVSGDPVEPVISVTEKGNVVTITGGIKSRLQRQRIIDTLTNGLKEHEIVDELKSGAGWIPLGWENRLAQDLLIPYISVVEDAELHYKEGIVRLEGSVNAERNIRDIQMKVIDVINGPYSKDISNNLSAK